MELQVILTGVLRWPISCYWFSQARPDDVRQKMNDADARVYVMFNCIYPVVISRPSRTAGVSHPGDILFRRGIIEIVHETGC